MAVDHGSCTRQGTILLLRKVAFLGLFGVRGGRVSREVDVNGHQQAVFDGPRAEEILLKETVRDIGGDSVKARVVTG